MAKGALDVGPDALVVPTGHSVSVGGLWGPGRGLWSAFGRLSSPCSSPSDLCPLSPPPPGQDGAGTEEGARVKSRRGRSGVWTHLPWTGGEDAVLLLVQDTAGLFGQVLFPELLCAEVSLAALRGESPQGAARFSREERCS